MEYLNDGAAARCGQGFGRMAYRSTYCAAAAVLSLLSASCAEAANAACQVFDPPLHVETTDRIRIEERASDIKGKPSDVALSIAAEPASGKHLSCLVVQCAYGEVNVYVESGLPLVAGRDRKVTALFRINGGPAARRPFTLSQDGLSAGLWRTDQAIAYVRELADGAVLYLSVLQDKGPVAGATFKIDGIKTMMAKAQACTW